jgi:hypothetical protein
MINFIKSGSYYVDKKYIDPNRLKVRAENPAIMQELLELVSLLRSGNFDLFLSHGTCLGLVRDGSLIPWDEDADIGIISKVDRETDFTSICKTLEDTDFVITKYNQKKTTICVTKSGFIFDINIYIPIGPFLVSSLHYDFITFKHVIGKPTLLDWNDAAFPIPQFSNKYLQSLYGVKWHQPRQYNFKSGRKFIHALKKCLNLVVFGVLSCVFS